MGQFFNSSGYLESSILVSNSGTRLDFSSLSPFLRVLLTTDGTVTKSLESYFWEPVDVRRISQEVETLTEDLPLLSLNKGATVIARQVKLEGTLSARCFAAANSYISPDALPEYLRRDLSSGKLGIGELLREKALESYRDIVDYGLTHVQNAENVWRTYLIVINSQPAIQITELFPLDLYT